MGKTAEQAAVAAISEGVRKPVLVIRWGRGRLGGSGKLLYMIQRARAQGRTVRPLDGDHKSKTLQGFYPEGSDGGCSIPTRQDAVGFKEWLLGELDMMAEDRESRVVDVSGGDSVMESVLQDLQIPEFCEAIGFGFLWLCPIGPETEDFLHVSAEVTAGRMAPANMLFVFNEGAIRSGQSPAGAFDPIIRLDDFQGMMKGGARLVYMKKLPCMDILRDQHLDYFDVAAERAGPNGVSAKATACFMTRKWIEDMENEHVRARSAELLP